MQNNHKEMPSDQEETHNYYETQNNNTKTQNYYRDTK